MRIGPSFVALALGAGSPILNSGLFASASPVPAAVDTSPAPSPNPGASNDGTFAPTSPQYASANERHVPSTAAHGTTLRLTQRALAGLGIDNNREDPLLTGDLDLSGQSDNVADAQLNLCGLLGINCNDKPTVTTTATAVVKNPAKKPTKSSSKPKKPSTTKKTTPKKSGTSAKKITGGKVQVNDKHHADGGSAKAGNGGQANGGNSNCSTSGSMIGLNALNFNSCNGGQGGDASGGNATGGAGGSTSNNLLKRSTSASMNKSGLAAAQQFDKEKPESTSSIAAPSASSTPSPRPITERDTDAEVTSNSFDAETIAQRDVNAQVQNDGLDSQSLPNEYSTPHRQQYSPRDVSASSTPEGIQAVATQQQQARDVFASSTPEGIEAIATQQQQARDIAATSTPESIQAIATQENTARGILDKPAQGLAREAAFKKLLNNNRIGLRDIAASQNSQGISAEANRNGTDEEPTLGDDLLSDDQPEDGEGQGDDDDAAAPTSERREFDATATADELQARAHGHGRGGNGKSGHGGKANGGASDSHVHAKKYGVHGADVSSNNGGHGGSANAGKATGGKGGATKKQTSKTGHRAALHKGPIVKVTRDVDATASEDDFEAGLAQRDVASFEASHSPSADDYSLETRESHEVSAVDSPEGVHAIAGRSTAIDYTSEDHGVKAADQATDSAANVERRSNVSTGIRTGANKNGRVTIANAGNGGNARSGNGGQANGQANGNGSHNGVHSGSRKTSSHPASIGKSTKKATHSAKKNTSHIVHKTATRKPLATVGGDDSLVEIDLRMLSELLSEEQFDFLSNSRKSNKKSVPASVNAGAGHGIAHASGSSNYVGNGNGSGGNGGDAHSGNATGGRGGDAVVNQN
ncbi:hypothetical protein CBOM_04642 [Ceraceosorus bombacis]|uniref:Uncharacterized protein n=1 Tax=Ceraceosorus bombacis TaxID=401625 RepID=A0A0P1BQS6_9BASI|nr:hypothetical protein CBOM_04642 [Ceraceosorus bombacis]